VKGEGAGGISALSMVGDGSGVGIGETQGPQTVSWKIAKSASLVTEPPRPGHAFSQVVRAQSGAGQMHAALSSMAVSGGVLEPAPDSLDTLYQAWNRESAIGSECLVSPFAMETDQGGSMCALSAPASAGGNLMKPHGLASTGAGSGIMMVNGGRMDSVSSPIPQGPGSGGVVSPHATSVDSDKSSTFADVDMLLPQTPSSFPKLDRKRAAEASEQMALKNMVVQQYDSGSGVVVAKRARSLDTIGGAIANMNRTSSGGYVPDSLQLAAAVVQPTSSPGLLLDGEHVIASGGQRTGRSQRMAMVPVVSGGELAASQVQFGIAEDAAQTVVTAQNGLQPQVLTPRLQPINTLEVVRTLGSAAGHDNSLVGRMTVSARVPVEHSMHSQGIAGHSLSHVCTPNFSAGYLQTDDVQHHGPPKRKIQRKRENLPKESTALLKQWLLSHMLLPYPGNEEKLALCRATNLEMAQINNWFINARVRIWKPLVQKVFDQYDPILRKQAEEENDEQQLKRIRDARKSSTLNMITVLSGLPEARKELDEIASKSKALSRDC